MQLLNRTLRSLLRILDAAVQQDGAIAGNIQLYNPASNGLEIVVQRGFAESFIECFRIVPTDGVSVCARAFRLGRRLAVFDVSADPQFEPYLPIAQSAGFQSVQSTPILDSDECVIGINSTAWHWTRPGLSKAPRPAEARRSPMRCSSRVNGGRLCWRR